VRSASSRINWRGDVIAPALFSTGGSRPHEGPARDSACLAGRAIGATRVVCGRIAARPAAGGLPRMPSVVRSACRSFVSSPRMNGCVVRLPATAAPVSSGSPLRTPRAGTYSQRARRDPSAYGDPEIRLRVRRVVPYAAWVGPSRRLIAAHPETRRTLRRHEILAPCERRAHRPRSILGLVSSFTGASVWRGLWTEAPPCR
jgi:hypothetical protein